MEIRKIKQRNVHVAILIDTWFPVHGSAQAHVAKLAAALSEEYGYEVDILTRHMKGHLTRDEKAVEGCKGVHVHRLTSFRFLFLIVSFFWLVFSGKRYHVYHAQGALTAFPMKLASWITRVPTLVTIHAHSIFQTRWSLKKIIDRVMLLETKYSKQISVTERFMKAKNVNEQVLVIPNGIDAKPFDEVKNETSSERFDVLFVGPLIYQKGLDVLLRAVKQVVDSTEFIQSRKDFILHIVGHGPELNLLRKLSEELEINKYLRFYSKLSEEALIDRYKNSHLFVLPSRWDGLPLPLLQACAAGLPILATDVGDHRRLVLENTNGHLVHPDDTKELAYYLEHFALNPQLSQMGENSRSLVGQEYNWDTTLTKNLRVYEAVVDQEEEERANKKWIMPWKLPFLKIQEREWTKPTKKGPLRFCLTMDVENSVDIESFLQRSVEFADAQGIAITFFFDEAILEMMSDPIKQLQKMGHEIGVKIPSGDWSTIPGQKKSLRHLQDHLAELNLSDVRMLRPPQEITEETMELIHEHGFEYLAVSEDPVTKLIWHYALPFGRHIRFDLETMLRLSEEELIESLGHLQRYWKAHGIHPFMIFASHSWEFTSQDDDSHASGENFSRLARLLAMIDNHADVEYLSLSAFCKSCSL
jgi:glycosyltransferase involved in cell wall biosynthesis